MQLLAAVSLALWMGIAAAIVFALKRLLFSKREKEALS